MSRQTRTILLFTRAPEAEARAKGLPIQPGARLFEAFLAGWRERAAQTGAHILVAAPKESLGAMRRLLPEADFVAQHGPGIGARMEAAFAHAFTRGARSVLMAGGDSPALPAEEVEAAFAHLEANTQAVALAPAPDGGVNLIGYSAHAERRLASVSWFTPKVDAELRAASRAAGLALWLSSAAPDLDRAADLVALYRLCRGEARWRIYAALIRRLLQSAPLAPLLVAPVRKVFLPASGTRGPPALLLSASL